MNYNLTFKIEKGTNICLPKFVWLNANLRNYVLVSMSFIEERFNTLVSKIFSMGHGDEAAAKS